MAKKVPIKESEIIKEFQITKKRKHKINILLIIAIISIIGNGVLFSLYLIEKNNIKEKEIVKHEECDNDCPYSPTADLITHGSSTYTKDKLDFIDKNIVFVIEGQGNYYYNYDCMMKKMGSSEFTYWAYNKEAAQSEGYYEGSCN